MDARVDDSGNATVELLPVQTYAGTFASGTATIAMHVIRPGGDRDNMPDLTLGSGQTFITWSAPQLSLRAVLRPSRLTTRRSKCLLTCRIPAISPPATCGSAL